MILELDGPDQWPIRAPVPSLRLCNFVALFWLGNASESGEEH
jgi:hypothetical protein